MMINFSTVVSHASSFVLDENTSFTDPSFVRILDALVITMGASLSSLTPSQEEVINDFWEWTKHNMSASKSLGKSIAALFKSNEKLMVKPVFFYANLNEGHSMVVIWTNAKREIGYLA